MLSYIRGKLAAHTVHYCVIDVSGVGYKLFIPSNATHMLPQLGEEIMLHCSLIIRELSHSLYGFISPMERELFEQLLAVTGVGPKLALSVIGHISYNDLLCAIAAGNTAPLCKIPGIGKKTAERLLIEMRDKLELPPSCDVQGSSAGYPSRQLIADALSALINLGYTQNSSQKAIQQSMESTKEPHDLATLITSALQHL